ncbi:SagB/ThcOx family dehydrogenase [Streptomyces sp. NPDC001678]|uniref:SagB/ThcOx family dehydrogenase n=1 Tax=Streptomyces sp. NPDC001678 TaxID=3364599 RepID=UPI00369F60D7
MPVRRARSIVCYWHDNTFVAENYRTRTTVSLEPLGAELLNELGEWIEEEKAATRFPDFDPESVLQSLAELEAAGLVVRDGDPGADGDEVAGTAWPEWNVSARYLHAMTRDAPYTEDTPELRARLASERERPALFKSYPDADTILLPRAPRRLDAPFEDVLYGRRTHRAFADRDVPLADFSALLAAVFGPAAFIDADAYGGLMQRTSASAGARQETEAYVLVRRVADVAPGVYHYNVLTHALEFLAECPPWQDVARLSVNQRGIEDAAFVVVLTALTERLRSKYRTARTYRIMLMDAGHFAQTFAMVATALGLGPFQTAAFTDSAVEGLLGLDGVEETALYLLGAGVPAEGPEGTEGLKRPAGLEAFRGSRPGPAPAARPTLSPG